MRFWLHQNPIQMLPFQEMNSIKKTPQKLMVNLTLLNTLKNDRNPESPHRWTGSRVDRISSGIVQWSYRYCSRNVGITLRRIPKFAHSYCITLRYRPQYDGYL